MLEDIPLDEIVTYISGLPSNGDAPGPRPPCLDPKPMMLGEAVKRALLNHQAGGRPKLIIRGVEFTELQDFLSIAQRPDFAPVRRTPNP